jgi:hypothetical protein
LAVGVELERRYWIGDLIVAISGVDQEKPG